MSQMQLAEAIALAPGTQQHLVRAASLVLHTSKH